MQMQSQRLLIKAEKMHEGKNLIDVNAADFLKWDAGWNKAHVN